MEFKYSTEDTFHLILNHQNRIMLQNIPMPENQRCVHTTFQSEETSTTT